MKNILIYLGATFPANSLYTQVVQELGEELARRGLTLVFGGSKAGTMAILADAVLQNGGKAIGVFPRALPANFLHPGLTTTYFTDTIAERKTKMHGLADAIIALPGSFGTWDELFDALELAKIERMHGRPAKPIALLNLEGFYDGIVTLLQRSLREGYTSERFADLLYCAATLSELTQWLDALP